MNVNANRMCYSCGGCIERTVGPVPLRFRDHDVIVPDVAHSRCVDCGETLFSIKEAEGLQRAAAEIVRTEQGLLTGAKIRTWRSQTGLTQEELESALGVGAKTVTRWERGLVFQSATADRLMRLAMRFPKVLRVLRTGDLYTDAFATGAVMSFGRMTTTSCLDGLLSLTQGFVPATKPEPIAMERKEVTRDAIAAAA